MSNLSIIQNHGPRKSPNMDLLSELRAGGINNFLLPGKNLPAVDNLWLMVPIFPALLVVTVASLYVAACARGSAFYLRLKPRFMEPSMLSNQKLLPDKSIELLNRIGLPLSSQTMAVTDSNQVKSPVGNTLC